MGTPWCANLPTVTVTRTETPKSVTLIYPYYDNQTFLARQIAHWRQFPEELRAHLLAVIVDDGSPKSAAEVLVDVERPFPIRLFRIDVDVRWNWLAARNIGAHHAADGWCVVTDMDHMVPATTAHALIYGKHDPSRVYAFARREHTGAVITPHSASFLMTRAMFWKVGGYDEAFSGYYGTDGLYRRRLAATAPIVVLTDELVRHEYVGDSSTLTYKRKQPQDAAVRKIAERIPPGARPKTLSFPYHEVTL